MSGRKAVLSRGDDPPEPPDRRSAPSGGTPPPAWGDDPPEPPDRRSAPSGGTPPPAWGDDPPEPPDRRSAPSGGTPPPAWGDDPPGPPIATPRRAAASRRGPAEPRDRRCAPRPSSPADPRCCANPCPPACGYFLLRRCTRVFRSSLRCFFLAIRLRRFLMTEPTKPPSLGIEANRRTTYSPDAGWLGPRQPHRLPAAQPSPCSAPVLSNSSAVSSQPRTNPSDTG